jgi:hypothetical protein
MPTCMHLTQAPCMHIYTHTSNPSMHYDKNSWLMIGHLSTT